MQADDNNKKAEITMRRIELKSSESNQMNA